MKFKTSPPLHQAFLTPSKREWCIKVNVACAGCGKTFERYLSDHLYKKRNGGCGRAFCSQECYLDHVNNRESRECPTCGKIFSVAKWERDYGKKYCNMKCRPPPKPVSCSFCGETTLKTAYALRNFKNSFCNYQCSADWHSVNLSGEKSIHWLGGHENYYGENWRRQRKKARTRDKNTCQKCGLTKEGAGKDLDVHHFKPFKLFKDYKEANELSNLITLCHSCHLLIEPRAWLREEYRNGTLNEGG